MPLNLLIKTQDGVDYIVRKSEQPFSIGLGRVTAADSTEVIHDDDFSQVQTNAALPNDWQPWAYKWTGAAFAQSPRYPTPAGADPLAAAYAAHVERWKKKTWIPPHEFPGLVEGAGISYGRIADDKNGAFVRDTLLGPTLERVDPLDAKKNFFKMVLKLRTTNHSVDGQPLLPDAAEAAIAALWPNKPLS
jgi:hypothetical protein